MSAASNPEPLARVAESPFPLTAVDRHNLTQSDDQFQKHTWQELKDIIDLRRYIKWSSDIKAEYGSVPTYVMKRRLHWSLSSRTTLETGPLFEYHSAVPFESPHDYKILPNDWPYGLEDGIVHLIVWLRNRLEVDPKMGDLTPLSRRQVEDFVQTKFVRRVEHLPGPAEKVIWFKNWAALQSVPGMDHVHVLVRDVPDAIIQEWTGGEEIVQ